MKKIKFTLIMVGTVFVILGYAGYTFAADEAVSATPAVAMSTSAGNTTLGDGFFASNYYSSPAFNEATTRSLKIAGFLSGVLGVLFLVGGRLFPTRFYS